MSVLPATGAPRPDAQVKAALLTKFLHYINWPDKSLPKPDQPITIGILGDDPVGRELAGIVSDGGYIVKGRAVAVKRSSRPGDLTNCQAVFIPKSVRGEVAGILAGFQTSGVLTVSDMDGFTDAGGMIGFRTDGERVRFQINQPAVRKEGLRITADLLSIAEKRK